MSDPVTMLAVGGLVCAGSGWVSELARARSAPTAGYFVDASMTCAPCESGGSSDRRDAGATSDAGSEAPSRARQGRSEP